MSGRIKINNAQCITVSANGSLRMFKVKVAPYTLHTVKFESTNQHSVGGKTVVS